MNQDEGGSMSSAIQGTAGDSACRLATACWRICGGATADAESRLASGRQYKICLRKQSIHLAPVVVHPVLQPSHGGPLAGH